LQNKKKAFIKLVNKPEFRLWLKKKAGQKLIDVVELERMVDRWMADEYLKIECYKPE
jgi:hypothetical protein